MAAKKHVQLIDKVSIPAGVILNLWDLKKHERISLEMNTDEYAVGEVLILDRTGDKKKPSLKRSKEHVDPETLLIPREEVVFTAPVRRAGDKRFQPSFGAFITRAPKSAAAMKLMIKASHEGRPGAVAKKVMKKLKTLGNKTPSGVTTRTSKGSSLTGRGRK